MRDGEEGGRGEGGGDLGGDDLKETHVQVTSPELIISIGGVDLNRSLGDIEQGDVKSASPEVVDEDVMDIGLLVEVIGNRRCGGLLDDSNHLSGAQVRTAEKQDERP
jgi:hypothetical protein